MNMIVVSSLKYVYSVHVMLLKLNYILIFCQSAVKSHSAMVWCFNYRCFIGLMIFKGKRALLKPGNSEMKYFLKFYFISTSCSSILYFDKSVLKYKS